MAIWMTLWLVCSSPAWAAGSVEDAQRELSKAYNEFYRALSQNPNMTAQEKANLSKQMIDPKRAAVSRAVHSQTLETLKNAKPPAKPLVDMAKFGPLRNGKGVASDPKEDAPARKAVRATPVSAPRPETALDGSKVPREIEFPGKKPSK